MTEPDRTAAALACSIALGLSTFGRITADDALSAAEWYILGQAADVLDRYYNDVFPPDAEPLPAGF